MSSPVGTWTLLSMSSRDEVTGDETKVWGDAPLGFLTYTEDGRMSAVLAAAGAPSPPTPAARLRSRNRPCCFVNP